MYIYGIVLFGNDCSVFPATLPQSNDLPDDDFQGLSGGPYHVDAR